MLLLALCSGCVRYTERPDGSKSYTSFLKSVKANQIEVGDMKIKGMSSTGDTEMLKAGVDAAVSAAIKGVKP